MSSESHIFLGELIHLFGPRLHGEAWTKEEPYTVGIEPLPSKFSTAISQADIHRGASLLYEHCELYRARCGKDVLSSNYPMPLESEWPTAVQLAADDAERTRQQFFRFFDICWLLQDSLRCGKLQSATRNYGGGAEVPQTRSFWNTENFYPRFKLCRVNLDDPYNRHLPPDEADWIFIERANLNAVLEPTLQPQELINAETIGGVHLSPYLQCMIATTQALAITKDKQLLKKTVEAEIPKHWRGSGMLKPTTIGYMATFIREPESQRRSGIDCPTE